VRIGIGLPALPLAGRTATLEAMLGTMRRVWAGEVAADASCHDLLLFPCSGDMEQITRLAESVASPMGPPPPRRTL
jgi:hypothetical protein